MPEQLCGGVRVLLDAGILAWLDSQHAELRLRRHRPSDEPRIYFRTRHYRSWLQLAALVVRAEAREPVTHRNGDALDCRAENLERGWASPWITQRATGWRVYFRLHATMYCAGTWRTREWAEEMRELVKPLVAEAREQQWSKRDIRGAVDRAIGRVRRRKRRPKGEAEDEAVDLEAEAA